MKIIECVQYSDEYWKEKLGKPSASNASKLLTNEGKPSKQREGYLHELCAERLTGKQEEAYKNLNMMVGNEREAESRELYELTHKVKVQQVGVVYKDEERKFLCSPDGIVKKQYGLELKNPLPKTHVKYMLNGNLLDDYFGQCQFSLYVTGFKYWVLMSYSPGLRPFIVKVSRDENYISILAKELDKFCKDLDDITEKLK